MRPIRSWQPRDLGSRHLCFGSLLFFRIHEAAEVRFTWSVGEADFINGTPVSSSVAAQLWKARELTDPDASVILRILQYSPK